MSANIFSDFDFSSFWLSDYQSEAFPSDDLILSIEQELGYKLPTSYIDFMRYQNGGKPRNRCYPTTESTSWSGDHSAISNIMSIGNTERYSLCGAAGNAFWIEGWQYPDTGIYICTCPSAGHDMVMLDYSNLNSNGEPKVVHVDQEYDYEKTVIADDFETFVRGLLNCEEFD